MRYQEIIIEAATAPLYHGTTFASAMDIIADKAFRPYTSIGMDRNVYYGISSTRSPRLSHIDHNPDEKPWEKDTIEGFNVIFVLDQNKIRQKYKLIPYDFFKGTKSGVSFQDVNKLRDARSESEEFIVIGKDSKSRLPLAGNVSKIIYFANSFKNPDTDEPDVDTYLVFKKRALLLNIPVVLNRTLFGYSDNDRPWNVRLRQSMITHPTKNEVSADPKDFEVRSLLQLANKYDRLDGANLTTEQLNQVFSKGELFAIWNFWLHMNGRFPSQLTQPVSNKVMAVVFKALKTADPRTKTVYRKISPATLPKTPEEKKQIGLRKIGKGG